MYHVSAQGLDERMINVHYYYYYVQRHERFSKVRICNCKQVKRQFQDVSFIDCWARLPSLLTEL